MEARASQKRKWVFDDTKWIIGLLITLVIAITVNTTRVGAVIPKVNKMYQEYVPVVQLVDVIKLLQTERHELVGIAKRDSVAIKEALTRYDELVSAYAKSMTATRSAGGGSNGSVNSK